MTQKHTSSFTIDNPLQCRSFTTKNRRCRLPISDAISRLCFRHSSQCKPNTDLLISALSDSTDLSPNLILQFSDPKSPTQINDFLHQLVKLLVQGRVSTKRASVLAFLASQLLRSLPAIYKELHPNSSNEEEFRIVFGDLPRPDHGRPTHDPFHPDRLNSGRLNEDRPNRDPQARQST